MCANNYLHASIQDMGFTTNVALSQGKGTGVRLENYQVSSGASVYFKPTGVDLQKK